jgi:3-oxoacyl-[acyl-carrier protein] reductase
MLESLAGKAVLITGSSTGIGAAVAKGFGRYRARVAVHCNTRRDEAEAVAQAVRDAGGEAFVLAGNVARPGVAAELVGDAVAALGGLDVLVNNAGSLIRRVPLAEADDALYDEVMDLNVRSVIAATRAALPHMKERGGSIINTGSIAGRDGGGPGSGIYASAKAFVHNISRGMAKEFAPFNIRVNTVAPGVIRTPFHDATPPERMEAMRKAVALGRLGTAEDCVGAYLFLACEEMSRYITGQIIDVNGGQLMP